MKTETDRTRKSEPTLTLLISKLSGFISEYLDDLLPFIKRRPGLVSVLALIAFVLASGDLIEGLPLAQPLMKIRFFRDFHSIHNVLALAFIILVAYFWNVSVGGLLLGVFFAAHLPYFYLTFPGERMDILEIIIDSAVATGYLGMIFRRNIALRAAQEAAERAAHLAGHDPLTDLPNRALFQLEAQRTMAIATRNRSQFAVMFVDINDFKDVNDSLGHDVGDECLINLATRLRETVREGDLVARLGGDEFAIIADKLDNAEDASFLAERLIGCTTEPIIVGEHKLNVSLSIGIALYPAPAYEEGAAGPMELLSHADMAMYKAKSAGQGSFKFYNRYMSVKASERIALLTDLRDAIERNQLTLLYQPLFDMRTGVITSAEALLRWKHPERGMVLPGVFIPAAETSGQIIPIGQWVVEEACAQNRAWQDAGLPRIKISVNLSPVQLKSPPLVGMLANVLARTGLDPKYLDLELTENVFIRNIESASRVLHGLKGLGVSLSLDDFGTGYTSLSFLHRLSVDTVKMDRAFVKGLCRGSESAAIVEAIITLGHSLGLTLTGEGIESEAELEYLRELGCDYGQGYYFSQPVSAGDLARLLEENSRDKTRV